MTSKSEDSALSEAEANAVYDVLVEHAGEIEREYDRADFVRQQMQGCVEYRFMGALGFGGKFWNNGNWYVGAYSEDRTPERDAAIQTTNEALRALYDAHTAARVAS